MSSLKIKFLSPIVALALYCNAYADEINYSIKSQSLKDAIEVISKKSKIPYIVSGNLLEGKTSKAISDVKGTKKALDEILKDSGLEAVIEEGAIIIKKKTLSNNSNSLGDVNIVASSTSTEGTGSYTTAAMNSATRMNLSIKDTPQSVSVITSQQIDDMGLEDISDIVQKVVGLSINNFDSERNKFSARGFDINNYQLDGVTTSWETGYSAGQSQLDLIAYDRVEVVRGATGLLSGAGNPSAAINLVRKHANKDSFGGDITIEGGSWNKRKVSLDVGMPLNEDKTVRARIATSYEDKEAFYDYYENKKSVFYGVVDMDLSDATRVSLGAGYQKNNPKGSMWGSLSAFYSDGSDAHWSRSKSTAPKWSHWASENKNYFANIEHFFKNDIKLYGAYSHTKDDANLKLLYLYGNLDKTTGSGLTGQAYLSDTVSKQDNIDIYTSIPISFSNLDHELIAGVMYNNQKFKAYAAPNIYLPINDFYNWDGNISEPNFSNMDLIDDITTKQIGAYLVGRFSLSEELKLILGSRITNWQRDDKVNNTKFEHNRQITPYAGLVYELNDNFSTYLSYTSIFNPQNKKDINENYLEPLEGNSYETGIKGSFFDDKLNASFTVFRIEQDNLAKEAGKYTSKNEYYYEEKEGTTSKGFEFEISGEITDNWNTSLAYSQFEAKDANNEKVNIAYPRKTVNFFTKYEFAKFSIGAGVDWQSKTSYTKFGNAELVRTQKSYFLANMMMQYKLNKNLLVQANVDNLFDKKYYNDPGRQYGEPRSFTAKLKYKF
ncbi:MAG: TonB-dependent siderophore receptor [Arcobacter sp.]|uniref:TonB-dependent siderophore receptor n=1 Tax=Arcobacter sp. TaxID=1872629 RepID=UPI003C71AD13